MPLLVLIKAFFKEQGARMVLALIIGLFDTCTNILILLSLGKGLAIMFNDASTKAGLFDTLIPGINDQSSFLVLFVVLIITKGITVALDHFLQDYLGDSFVFFIRKKIINAADWEDISGDGSFKLISERTPLRNVITKGFIEAAGDLLFVVVLLGLFVFLQPLIAAVFVLMAVVFLVFSFSWATIIEQRRKLKNDRNQRWQSQIRMDNSEMLVAKAFNRQGALKKKLLRSIEHFKASQDSYFKSKAIVEGAFPIFFFAMLGAFILLVDSKTNDVGQFYSLLLLMLYSQGSFRRLNRLPAIWKAGFSAADALPDRFLTQRHTEPLEGRASKLIVASVAEKRIDSAFELGKLVVFNLDQRPELKSVFVSDLLALTSGSIRFSIEPSQEDEATPFEIRRSIVAATAMLPLAGKSIEEAVAFSKSEKARDRIWGVLEKINKYSGLNLQPDTVVDYENKKLLIWLQLARVEYTRKPFVIIDLECSFLSRTDRLKVLDFIHYLKGKRCVILLSASFTEGMLVDQQIEV